MANQKYTNQEFLFDLLFHIMALQCTILTNTQLKFLKLKEENNSAKNSATFSNYIRNVPIEDDGIMVSFDVNSLYTNIPIIDTPNIIKDCVNNDDQFTRKMTVTQDRFFHLVHLVLTLFRIGIFRAAQWQGKKAPPPPPPPHLKSVTHILQ